MKLTKKLQAEILKIYNTYWDAYLAGDMKTFASMLDDNIKVFGTAVSEVFNNKTETVRFYKATADQMTGKAEFRNRKIKMNPVDETMLIHEQCDLFVLIENEWIFYSPVRVSAIFVNTPKGWKLTHQHGSFPDSRAEAGEQIAPEKIRKENLELREAIKRRTAELENKNRELEIEASLEKVRTIAMGMRKPDDMLDVCKTISLQLQSLGVKEIRNVQTAIIYASKSIYINYEYYAKHKKQLITEVDFKSHYYQKLFVNKMLKGIGEIFSKTLKGKKVKEWYDHQKTTNQFADSYLEKAKSLSYYWFSLGPLALGISTYSPLSEEELNLFKRFRNVFELAYQRYLDIEKAETQAREAQIEASLERVRAVAMSMNKSDDLLSICEVSFNEFKKLGFDNIRNALIHIQYDNQKYFMDYDFSDLTGGAITKIEYGSHPVVEDYLKQIRSAKDAFYQGVIKEDQLEEWKDFRRNSGQIYDPRLDKATALYYYFFSIGKGDIGISTLKSIDESQIKILKRFRNVFSLSYRRYIDITLAETQAREAQIEAALERVRSRSMAMHKSDELLEAGEILFSEMQKLGIGSLTAGYVLLDEEEKNGLNYAPNPLTKKILPLPVIIPHNETIHMQQVVQNWKKGNPFFIVEMDEAETIKHQTYIAERSTNFPLNAAQLIAISPAKLFLHNFYFKEGYLLIVGGFRLSEDQTNIMLRFTKVFQQTYTRFLDLQKAEAQAREAKIEAALERVRSRTMGMQRSDELQDAAVLLFQQVVALGVPAFGSGFNIWDDDRKSATAWMAGQDRMQPPFKTSSSEDIFLRIYNSAQKGESLFVEEQGGEALKLHYDYMNSIPVFKEIADKMALAGQLFPTIQIMHCAFFSHGYLMFISFEPVPAAYDIFKRFAKVFEQTYTRFLDLQRVEAQNKIIQAENDRKTKELEEARQLQLSMLPKKLPQLPNLDIAVYMKTATEVGGDYYDFNIDGNGTLTVLVGDATGHGMMSGMMVSIMKSFFISNKANIELKQFFENSNNSIKDMQLGRLMMGLIGLQITNEKIIATNAGMPSLLYFRNKSKKAGEFVSNNLPLGGMKGTKYSLKEIKYEKGDTLLLMSDGFAELKDPQSEQYGYTRIKEQFRSIAHKSANEIIEELRNTASQWLNGAEPDDDVTFVVIKVK